MKKTINIIACGIAVLSALTSCEGTINYGTTIDRVPPLAFIYAGEDNQQATTVVHTPSASLSDFSLVLPVRSNLKAPQNTKVDVLFDSLAAEAYIAKKGLGAKVLPSKNICIRKYDAGSEVEPSPNSQVTLTLPAGATMSVDSLSFALCGDLSALQEQEYVFAMSLKSDEIGISEILGSYLLLVNTVTRQIKPITSSSQIEGSRPAAISTFTITAPSGMTTPANLFDNKTNTYGIFPSAPSHEVVVDMQTTRKLSGWGFATGNSNNKIGYEFSYSVNGTDFESFGPCSSADQYKSSNNYYFALYAPVQARYFKFKTDFPRYSSGSNYRRYAEIYIYTVE